MNNDATKGPHEYDIRVKDNPDAPKSLSVSERDFDADPQRYLEIARGGQQVIVVDTTDSDRVVMVAGTNGVRIEVYDSEITELPDDIEANCDHIDYEAWLR